jgi:hypothetical protein
MFVKIFRTQFLCRKQEICLMITQHIETHYTKRISKLLVIKVQKTIHLI